MQHAAFSQWHGIPLQIHAKPFYDLLSQSGWSRAGFVKTVVGEVPTFPAALPSALVPWALLRSSTTHSLLSLW